LHDQNHIPVVKGGMVFTNLLYLEKSSLLPYMKKSQFLALAALLAFCTAHAQEENKSLFSGAYISGEYIYRSYGTNDQSGFGYGLEISKDYKKWLGFGLNVSYWKDEKLNWDFSDPFTGQRYQYPESIQEFKISPFVQFIPLNTRYFDFIIQAGLRTGYYKQVYYNGGYNTDYASESFTVTLHDVGNKNITLGYELGGSLRFQAGNVAITPAITLLSNDIKGNNFSALSLKVGWQIP
jgi:hypothetical protein